MACLLETKCAGISSQILVGAFLSLLLLSEAAADTALQPVAPGSQFSGTTWTCEESGATSIVKFNADGGWSEDYKDSHLAGRWKADSSDTEVTVIRTDDNSLFRYKMNPEKELIRESDFQSYRLCPWNDSNPAAVYSGTKWTCDVQGGTSVITFNADGTWTEDDKDIHLHGTWKANSSNTDVFVYQPNKAPIQYRLTAEKNLSRDLDSITYQPMISAAASDGTKTTDASSATGTTNATPVPPQTNHPADIVKLTEDQARAVVLIKGDNAEGTGFLIKTAGGPVVVTNIHVISNNPNLVITTNTGGTVAVTGLQGAVDRDLAMFSVKDDNYTYLDAASDVSAVAQPGDDVVTPGNSQGGEVMLNTGGKLLGIGPDRIEFDNPIYHGNSGGPVFDLKSGKVIGVVTEAIKVDVSDELDKTSFASRNSAIGNSVRYFGFRIDNVPKWEPYNWRRLQNETAFLDNFDERTKALDSFLNAPNDDKPEDNEWRKDDKITTANSTYFDRIRGADTSQQLDAARELYQTCNDLAGEQTDVIKVMANFYGFDQQRARDELEYRKALLKEMDDISNDMSRLGSMPRTNSADTGGG